MEIRNISFGGRSFIEAKTQIARFLILPDFMAKIVAWQIKMADNSSRDILFVGHDTDFSDENQLSSIGTNNVSLAEIDGKIVDLINLPNKKITTSANAVSIKSDTADVGFSVTHTMSDLFFRTEFIFENKTDHMVKWAPTEEFMLNIPWSDDLSLNNYNVFARAKKIMQISQKPTKFNGQISLESTKAGTIFHQFQDNVIKISTLSEEENITMLFDRKHSNTAVEILQKSDHCLSLKLINNLSAEENFPNCEHVMAHTKSTFSVELSIA